jgi:hypothetical protein
MRQLIRFFEAMGVMNILEVSYVYTAPARIA